MSTAAVGGYRDEDGYRDEGELASSQVDLTPSVIETASVGGGPADLLRLAVAVSAGAVTVQALGELDVYTQPLLLATVTDLLNGSEPVDVTLDVTLDLSALTFIDSSGLSALLACAKLAKERDRTLKVRPGDGVVARLFTLTGVGPVFTLI